jgi:uncharacterized membrane protein
MPRRSTLPNEGVPLNSFCPAPELIGILGWQDVMLGQWIYVCLTALMLLVTMQRLHLDQWSRQRVALVAGLVVIEYVVLVYLIFFITYTPIAGDHVRGVQGRYFVIALPVAAIFIAALLNLSLPRYVRTAAALAGAVLSGAACCQALLEAHWIEP